MIRHSWNSHRHIRYSNSGWTNNRMKDFHTNRDKTNTRASIDLHMGHRKRKRPPAVDGVSYDDDKLRCIANR